MFGLTPEFNPAVNCTTIEAWYLDDTPADEVGV
jgi:hypothetical protein